jgi:hypothetical protein
MTEVVQRFVNLRKVKLCGAARDPLAGGNPRTDLLGFAVMASNWGGDCWRNIAIKLVTERLQVLWPGLAWLQHLATSLGHGAVEWSCPHLLDHQLASLRYPGAQKSPFTQNLLSAKIKISDHVDSGSPAH